jgi:phage major head subunit gpT-like protein
MSLDQRVSALVASLKSEFWKAWEETAEPAPWEKFTTIVPSTTRIEHFINASPVPGMSEWFGHRNYGKVDSFIYSIRNKTFHNGFLAMLEDVEDEQTGFLAAKPRQLVERAKKFPGRAVLKLLSQGTTTPCFDGTNFFATSHTFGTANNLQTFTTADAGTSSATHANTYNLVALYHGNSVLKPLLWQNRSGPDFQTNAGSTQSRESRQVRWWCDLRGAPAFGYFWDAILCQITGLPSITEMHAIYQNMETAFRTFQLPKTIATEDGEYVHEQTQFSSDNLCLAGSTGLVELLRQSLNQDWTPQSAANAGGTGVGTVATTNLWKGFASYIVSAFLN